MKSGSIDARRFMSQDGEAGKMADHAIRLGYSGRLELEVRCREGASVSAVEESGELLFLGSGEIIKIREHLYGFVALNIEAAGPFRYDIEWSSDAEDVDPVSLRVVSVVSQDDATRIIMRQELESILRRSGILREAGVDPDDLIEEVEEDLDFDDDVDPRFADTDFMDQVGLDPVPAARPERPQPSTEPSDDPEATTLPEEAPTVSTPPPKPSKKASKKPAPEEDAE